MEAEYIALSQDMRDIIPLRQLLQEVGTHLNMEFEYTNIMHFTIFEYSNGALGLSKSPRTILRTRYIVVKYHFFREYVGEGEEI